MADAAAEFDARGVSLVAISADESGDSQDLAAQLGGAFPLLSDADLAVASAYGVASKHEEIAVPAVFLVEPDGRIRWHEIGDTIMDRVKPEDILRRLDEQ
ncbi:MAG: peroxiredoxin family protein [Myxococcales bacterium FL481]|nr:MAG: peroxiredoxin family protein [Myxococcales bacterium FL481]